MPDDISDLAAEFARSLYPQEEKQVKMRTVIEGYRADIVADCFNARVRPAQIPPKRFRSANLQAIFEAFWLNSHTTFESDDEPAIIFDSWTEAFFERNRKASPRLVSFLLRRVLRPPMIRFILLPPTTALGSYRTAGQPAQVLHSGADPQPHLIPATDSLEDILTEIAAATRHPMPLRQIRFTGGIPLDPPTIATPPLPPAPHMPRIDKEDSARRLARAITSDLILYNEAKIKGSQEDLFSILAEEIEESRMLYKNRVSEDIYHKNFYDQALVDLQHDLRSRKKP